MLEIADSYENNPAMSESMDEQDGAGMAEYLGKAVREFYK